MIVEQKPSPNFNARKVGIAIDLIVLHADASKSEASTIDWITHGSQAAGNPVSYHYLVHRDGMVTQFVADIKRAWHAGVSSYLGHPDCNTYSLGISFGNDQSGEPFTKAALDTGAELVAELCHKYAIPLDRITTHAVISPGRKHDPGPLFPIDAFLADVTARYWAIP